MTKLISPLRLFNTLYFTITLKGIKFWTHSSKQTVQTQIKLFLRGSLIRVFTVCYSVNPLDVFMLC